MDIQMGIHRQRYEGKINEKTRNNNEFYLVEEEEESNFCLRY